MTHWWISTPKITGLVSVKNGIIVDTCPVWWRWRGQRFDKFYHTFRVQFWSKFLAEILETPNGVGGTFVYPIRVGDQRPE
jgi:hypothetical protein